MKTLLVLTVGAFIGYFVGYIQADESCKDELRVLNYALQMQQLCAPQLTGNYEADMRRNVVVSAMCKEMALR